jgi:phosphoglycolate phosphatase
MHVFLDFDGTLADSSEGIHLAFTHACEEVGIVAPALNQFRPCIGPPIQVLARKLIPEIETNRLETLRQVFRAVYDHKYYERVEWYEGVIEGLKFLRGREYMRLSIVTNKPTKPTIDLISNAGIQDLFESVVGVDYMVTKGSGLVFRSKKEAISYALKATDCPSEQAVYVGDTPADRTASLESGVAFIAATYGFHLWQTQELEGTATAESFGDVMRCLNLLAGSREPSTANKNNNRL